MSDDGIKYNEDQITEKDGRYFAPDGDEVFPADDEPPEDKAEPPEDKAEPPEDEPVEPPTDEGEPVDDEEDEEDDDDEGEPLDEENEDDDEPILDPESGEDDDDDAEGEKDLGDLADKEIADAMRQVTTYAEWFEEAHEARKTIPDDFAALVAKTRVPPDFLVEREIYNLVDLVEELKAVEDQIDPKRITIPSEEASDEEKLEFAHKYFGIPKSADGYDDEKLFLGTEFEGDEDAELRMSLKIKAYKSGLSEEQARAYIQDWSDERKAHREQQEADMKAYVRENKRAMEATYGEDSKAVAKEISAILAQEGKEFYEEFKGDKVLSSANFVKFITNVAQRYASEDPVQRIGIASYSTDKIKRNMEKIGASKYFGDDAGRSEDKAVRKKHMQYRKRYAAYERELVRRTDG